MEHKSISNLKLIKNEVELHNKNIEIIAVSKTFDVETIKPLAEYGHLHFGENKIQEALIKWPKLKQKYPNLKLHMIGKIQSNKVKFLFPLFDYIHSLDSIKLAEKISKAQIKQNFKPKIFLQVNIGNETQKNGIETHYIENLLNISRYDLDLDVIGLMCIPPNNYNSDKYFREMRILKEKFKMPYLSMGMSEDYISAINIGSTHIRLGSKIFGKRSK
jgi:pyridoxal phosphate enzyme (YggS family)